MAKDKSLGERIALRLTDIHDDEMTETELQIAELLVLHDVAEWNEYAPGNKVLKVKKNG